MESELKTCGFIALMLVRPAVPRARDLAKEHSLPLERGDELGGTGEEQRRPQSPRRCGHSARARRVTARVPVYDTEMLIALADRKAKAVSLHAGLKGTPHRAIVLGPVLAQV
ncbi:hypothetical protein GCM10010442_69090 [Kitasatospora kifunensis]